MSYNGDMEGCHACPQTHRRRNVKIGLEFWEQNSQKHKSQVPSLHTSLMQVSGAQISHGIGLPCGRPGAQQYFFQKKTWNIITVQCTPRRTQIYFISPLHCSVLLLTVKGQKLALTFCSSKCLKINNLYRLGKNKFQYHI